MLMNFKKFKDKRGGEQENCRQVLTTDRKGLRNTEMMCHLRAQAHTCCAVSKQKCLIFSSLALSSVSVQNEQKAHGKSHSNLQTWHYRFWSLPCLISLSCFGPIFHHYVPFPPFWNGNVYSVSMVCRKYVICFMSLQGSKLRDYLKYQNKL